jgi:hypothetical protein
MEIPEILQQIAPPAPKRPTGRSAAPPAERSASATLYEKLPVDLPAALSGLGELADERADEPAVGPAAPPQPPSTEDLRTGAAPPSRERSASGLRLPVAPPTSEPRAAPEVGPALLLRREDGDEILPLVDGAQLVGRVTDSAIRIPSRGISRRHALLVLRDGRLTARDLGSQNGTFVDDVEIHEDEVAVRHGQRLRFGPVETVVRRDEPAADGAADATS